MRLGAPDRRLRTGVALVAVAIVLSAGALAWRTAAQRLDPTNPTVSLDEVERRVAADIPVPETTAPALASQIARGDTIVFDVRTRAEYDQSHIDGAILVDPDTSAESFLAAHGSKLAGKTAVFYCAVGVRSGLMVARLNRSGQPTQATATYNLRGGLFRWHAQGRPLMADHRGAAATIHPYDAAWGSLLDRTLAASRAPAAAPVPPR
jgi:rhodanese-related sulfurtransferase